MGGSAPGLQASHRDPSTATKKITKAMELIAASRIVKAQRKVAASAPVRAPSSPARSPAVGDRLQRQPPADHRGARTRSRAAVLLITSDRGSGRRLQRQRDQGRRAADAQRLRGEGKEVVTLRRRPQRASPTTASASASGRGIVDRASPTARPTRTPRRSRLR